MFIVTAVVSGLFAATSAASASPITPLPPVNYVAAKLRAIAPSPNFLGTRAIPIRAERFVVELTRAREDASKSPKLQALIAPARRLPPLQQLAFVQKTVEHNIRWTSDTTLWGRHDYWASAKETLDAGAGDMEDRAIVKMQALRALGFGPGDLFLTLARDQVGGPITVLTARVGGRYYVLDDNDDLPFDSVRRRVELQPELSFGFNGAWIHIRDAVAPVLRTAAATLTSGR